MVSKESPLESNSNVGGISVLIYHVFNIYHLMIINCNFIQAQNKIDVHNCGPFYGPRNNYTIAYLLN